VLSHHDGFGAKTSENGLFLYKSLQSDELQRSRIADYTILFSFLGLVGGYSPFLIVPLFAATVMQVPKRLAVMHYFTFHAELLPHTEQVVFHKVGLYGKVRRIYVDIKNLEKIDHTTVPSNY